MRRCLRCGDRPLTADIGIAACHGPVDDYALFRIEQPGFDGVHVSRPNRIADSVIEAQVARVCLTDTGTVRRGRRILRINDVGLRDARGKWAIERYAPP